MRGDIDHVQEPVAEGRWSPTVIPAQRNFLTELTSSLPSARVGSMPYGLERQIWVECGLAASERDEAEGDTPSRSPQTGAVVQVFANRLFNKANTRDARLPRQERSIARGYEGRSFATRSYWLIQ